MKNLILFLILTMFCNAVNAQWEIVSNGQYPSLKAIDFPTESIGYACGDNFVLKTLDGGDSWEYIETNYNFSSIAFVSSDIGYASGPNKTICKTIDGGFTWSKLNVPNLGEEVIDFKEISFKDEQNGFMAAGTYIVIPDFWIMYAVGYILKTSNGGLNWSVKNVYYEMNAINIVKNSNVVFAAGGTFAPMGSENILLKSSDFGGSWEQIEGAIETPFMKINSLDEEKVIISSYYEVYLSFNGGNSFENFSFDTLRPNQQPIYNCFFANENEFYIIGKNSLFYRFIISENRFEKINIAGLNHDLLSFFIINNVGFIVGTNGLIMRNETITSTNEIPNLNSSTRIYPNPTSNYINIEFYEYSTYDVKVFNLQKMVKSQIFEGRSATISLENLNSGVYFVLIKSNKGVCVKKVIKL